MHGPMNVKFLHTEADTHHTTFWNNLHNSKQEQ